MALSKVDTTTPNGKYIGDPAKTAFEKINANFDELDGSRNSARSIATGGTGATSARDARTNLGLATSSIDAVPLANGGTGSTTAAGARTNLGIKSAALAELVGTVSASGTAIFEFISNLNGEAVRFADGTQFCSFESSSVSSTTSQYGNVYVSGVANFNFPAEFIDVAKVNYTSRSNGGGAGCWTISGQSNAKSASAYALAVNNTGQCYLGYLAKGRWK